jgi:hypothetical protein
MRLRKSLRRSSHQRSEDAPRKQLQQSPREKLRRHRRRVADAAKLRQQNQSQLLNKSRKKPQHRRNAVVRLKLLLYP